ncbi:MAG: hypothetical protein A2W93_06345 [Bacteroidetes bacterium GWF2_43_63]|nr:MAG: hypothetical protein A2W93_06345 [Bacteroidetes bacterium GWF2_43_63]HBG71768.1 hypothetical protein [Bacteroidales bacterium]
MRKEMKEKDNRQQKKGSEVMEKAIKVVFPVVAGLFANILMLLLFFIIVGQNHALSLGYKHFFLYYAPLCLIIAILFQILIVIPVFCKYQFTTIRQQTIGIIALFIISVFGSVAFAYQVSSLDSTPFDYITDAIYSFMFIFVYWLINIYVMDKLCKIEDSERQD